MQKETTNRIIVAGRFWELQRWDEQIWEGYLGYNEEFFYENLMMQYII